MAEVHPITSEAVASGDAAPRSGLAMADAAVKLIGQSPVGRTARAALGFAVIAGGATTLIARRKVGGVKRNADHPLDALADPPTDVIHQTFATHDGGSIHYVDSAPGQRGLPTVVLLHGITNQWWMWSAVMRLLAQTVEQPYVRILSWDMRGFGSSAAGTEGVSIGAAAADLAAMLIHADVERAVVVGHSMGGMELARFLADGDQHAAARKRIGGALFLGTTARSLDGTIRNGGLVRLSSQSAKIAKAGLSPSLFSWEDNDLSILLLRNGFGRVATPRMIDDCRRCQSETPPLSMVQGLATIAEHDVRDALRRDESLRSLPTCIMVGSLDALTPPVHSRALHEALPHAELIELDGIGHNVMQEDPHVVVRAIRSLLNAVSSSVGALDRRSVATASATSAVSGTSESSGVSSIVRSPT